jgi:hypothetical protein
MFKPIALAALLLTSTTAKAGCLPSHSRNNQAQPSDVSQVQINVIAIVDVAWVAIAGHAWLQQVREAKKLPTVTVGSNNVALHINF